MINHLKKFLLIFKKFFGKLSILSDKLLDKVSIIILKNEDVDSKIPLDLKEQGFIKVNIIQFNFNFEGFTKPLQDGLSGFTDFLAYGMVRIAIYLTPEDAKYDRELLLDFKNELPAFESPVKRLYESFDVLIEAITQRHSTDIDFIDDFDLVEKTPTGNNGAQSSTIHEKEETS